MKHSRDEYAVNTGLGERSDCVVRAVSVAGCMDYHVAHALLKRHGRRDRKPTYIHTTIEAIREAFAVEVRYAERCTLASFVNKHQSGHYVLLTSSHALALVDGVVYDWASHPRCRVVWYFKLV